MGRKYRGWRKGEENRPLWKLAYLEADMRLTLLFGERMLNWGRYFAGGVEKNVTATKQTIRRCSASIVLLTSIVHRVILASSFFPFFDENFLMDRSDFQSPSNRILVSSCENLKGTSRVAVVYNYLSAWVTNGRSYFGRKSGLTRDAVQRLLLLDDRYLTCFFKKKKKTAKIPREYNKILTRDKVGPVIQVSLKFHSSKFL